MRLVLWIALAATLVALPLSAADFATGLAAYKNEDWATAFEHWLPLAESGMVEAQFDVGLLYLHGRGVEEDHVEAARWYRLAAEQGYVRAQYELADLYDRGDGVEKDVAEAFMWFRLAGRAKYKDARKRRRKVGDRLTPHEMALADLEAREWLRRHEDDSATE